MRQRMSGMLVGLAALVAPGPVLGQPSTRPKAPARWTISVLKRPFVKPAWAAQPPRERSCPRTEIRGRFMARNALDDAGVIESIRLLHHELERGTDDGWGPRIRLWLGQAYELRDFFPEAYHHYKQVATLKAGTRVTPAPTSPRNLDELRKAGVIGIARVCARVGLKRNAAYFLRQLKLQDAYLLSLTGEVYDRIGLPKQSDSAYKVAVATARNPPDGFGPTHPIFIRLNAVRMAYRHGNLDQASRLGRPYVKRARDAMRWPQEKTVHDNISAVLERIDSRRRPNLRTLADGTFEGTAAGWDRPLTMAVTIRKGRITAVVVRTHDEKRAFNAFTAIPERIVKTQRLDVDGVSGATATVYGIVAAVERALVGPPGPRKTTR